jgi:hypothetical protein
VAEDLAAVAALIVAADSTGVAVGLAEAAHSAAAIWVVEDSAAADWVAADWVAAD